ncbi:hypothetical protein FNAPI_9550 [Fusarium napiforme]|uniref:AB hydrolase-1 domain-containing protein n=1 Tax=Fusarium napiforme TaxID=42672 RepID=A0A8H5J001_9HYPO|nr:hypothetical protein FNAPI_9550 [Fusarium napiforme]
MSSTQKPTILLVHGAWHGSWAWKYQIPELESLGYPTQNLDLPSVSAQGKQVVVLAHSYGGPIGCSAITGLSITERAENNLPGGVLGLIILCGYIFPGGMDQGAVIRSLGGLPYVNWDTPSPGLFVAKDPGSLLYPPDVSDEQAQWALSQLQPQSMAANMGIVPPQAWQGESYKGRLAYIKATEDAVIPFSDQDGMVASSGGSEAWKICVLEGSGHSPQISRPKEVAQAVDSIIQDFPIHK